MQSTSRLGLWKTSQFHDDNYDEPATSFAVESLRRYWRDISDFKLKLALQADIRWMNLGLEKPQHSGNIKRSSPLFFRSQRSRITAPRRQFQTEWE